MEKATDTRHVSRFFWNKLFYMEIPMEKATDTRHVSHFSLTIDLEESYLQFLPLSTSYPHVAQFVSSERSFLQKNFHVK